MENPLKFVTRKIKLEGEELPPSWKTTTRWKGKPSPSVVTNLKNLKSSFPSIFRN